MITSTIDNRGQEQPPSSMVGACVTYYGRDEVSDSEKMKNGVLCHIAAANDCTFEPCTDIAKGGNKLFLLPGDKWSFGDNATINVNQADLESYTASDFD